MRELWSPAPDQVFVRWQLLALLGPLGQPEVDAFMDIYRESDAADREAYYFLQRANADTIQGLIRASRDPDTTRRRLAALLIELAVGGQVRAEHRKALVAPACQLLEDRDAEFRHYALEAIRELAGEQEARATLPVIAQEMSSPESRTRFAAAHTLAAFGDIALEHIRQAAHSEQPGTRVVACSALSVMRPFPKDDIGLPLSLAKDADPGVHRYALYALGCSQVDDPAVVAQLVKTLRDPETCDWATRGRRWAQLVAAAAITHWKTV